MIPINLSGLTANGSSPRYDPAFPTGNRGAVTPFIALFKDDFSTGTLGGVYPGWDSKSTYASDQPGVAGRSLKITVAPNTQANLDASACGLGSHSFGGRSNLPIQIPIGKSIWLQWRRYIPTNFTWGHCYAGSGDFAAANACGYSNDGNAWLKDLVFAPTNGTSRIYLQPTVSRRSIAQTAGNRIISENGPILSDQAGVVYPLGQWFTHQIQVYVHDTSAGYIREWINGTLVNSCSGANVSTGNSLNEWGIGNYWNGIPYTDGTAALSYWCRELIMATDVSGYGVPTGVDSNGFTFIDPATTVAGLL